MNLESEIYIPKSEIRYMSTEPNKVIYSMVRRQQVYDKKPVLKDIYLSYFYGREDWRYRSERLGQVFPAPDTRRRRQGNNGETVISPGFTVGYLEQEPLIDDSRTVREVVEEAVQETVRLFERVR